MADFIAKGVLHDAWGRDEFGPGSTRDGADSRTSRLLGRHDADDQSHTEGVKHPMLLVRDSATAAWASISNETTADLRSVSRAMWA